MNQLRRLVNSCLLPGVTGGALPDWLLRGLSDGLPGITIFPGPDLSIAGLVASVREIRPDAIIAVDEEGGDVTRLEYATGSSYPGNLALGVVDDPALTRQIATAMARDLIASGVNFNLAPSLDVGGEPDNPIIGVRSFGADPARVAAHGAAFIQAMQDAGVAVAAKHFPGHGATATDPHQTLPSVGCAWEILSQRELVPFAAAISSGAESLMIAHVVYDALDPRQPATMSRPILHDLLRTELGYHGVALSTAVAIEAGNTPERTGDVAVKSLQAGSDLLLLGPAVEGRLFAGIQDAVIGAVQAGALDLSVLRAAANRVDGLRHRADGHRRRADLRTRMPDGQLAGLTAARRAVAARGDITLPGPATVVEIREPGNVMVGAAHWSLIEPLRARGLVAHAVRVSGAAERPAFGAGPLVVVVRDAYRIAWQRDMLRRLLADRPDTIVVSVGMPDDAGLTSGSCIRTFGAGKVNLQAAAELLAGRRVT